MSCSSNQPSSYSGRLAARIASQELRRRPVQPRQCNHCTSIPSIIVTPPQSESESFTALPCRRDDELLTPPSYITKEEGPYFAIDLAAALAMQSKNKTPTSNVARKCTWGHGSGISLELFDMRYWIGCSLDNCVL